jgi:hypothetical protein
MQWKTMDTVPKDGSSVLLWCGDRMVVASYDFGDDEWVYAYTDIPRDNTPGMVFCSYATGATHWMPLPETPY